MKLKLLSLSGITAKMAVLLSPKLHSQDPFWDQAAQMLLLALVFYLHYEAPPDEQNFPMVMEMIRMMLGFAKNLVLPAPEPPHTKILRLRRCLRPSSPIATFCVSILFSVTLLSAYFFLTAWALPHLAEPVRNDALRDGKPTEDVDDLILKVIDAPTKRQKRRADREAR